mgnify:CR=1 FL=1
MNMTRVSVMHKNLIVTEFFAKIYFVNLDCFSIGNELLLPTNWALVFRAATAVWQFISVQANVVETRGSFRETKDRTKLNK